MAFDLRHHYIFYKSLMWLKSLESLNFDTSDLTWEVEIGLTWLFNLSCYNSRAPSDLITGFTYKTTCQRCNLFY